MDSSSTVPSQATIAAEVFERTSGELALRSDTFPQAVHDAHDDLRASVADLIGAGRQLEADLAELNGKRDLIPAAGLLRLRGEAVSEAESTAQEADGRARRALAALKDSLREAALPKLDRDREMLARQELTVLLGDASKSELRSRIHVIAARGSRDAAAALLSDFGRSLLESRGLTGRDLEESLSAARGVAAVSAAERKGATVDEIAASRAYQRLDSFGAAIGAAGLHFRNVVGKAR